jgi:hypothetical protein
MTDVVGIYFCMEWRWGGWPLFHSYLSMGVASNATYYTMVLIWWDGFLT